jgi:hypothetical protein
MVYGVERARGLCLGNNYFSMESLNLIVINPTWCQGNFIYLRQGKSFLLTLLQSG